MAYNFDFANMSDSQLAAFSRAGGASSVLNQAARDSFANAGNTEGRFDFLPPFLRGGSGGSQTATGPAAAALLKEAN
jgi:hypothetical protein